MISRDTREGKVMRRLFEKLDQMRQDLGDRVFDVVSELVSGTDLEDMIMGAIWGQRTIDEINTSIDQLGEGAAHEIVDRITARALATQFIDYSGLLEKTQLARENRLVPEYVQDFFLRAADKLGLRVTEREDGYTVTWVPYEHYREYNDDREFTDRYGRLERRYNWVTFDKTVSRANSRAEYVAPGHPLLEATVESLLKILKSGTPRTVYEDPTRKLHGTLWFLEGSIMDGTGEPAGRKVFCLYRSEDGELSEINPSVLWDLEAGREEAGEHLDGGVFVGKEEVTESSIDLVMEPFWEEVSERRQHEAQVKERYGLRSLNQQVMESQSKILDYEARQVEGEVMDVVIYNERQRSQELEARKAELEREIHLQQNVTIEAPHVLGVARVLPAPEEAIQPGTETETEDLRPKVEAVGMRVAMEYERDAGWEPQDVSGKNHGYDVRSMRYGDDGTFAQARYIEVKARARSGSIRLSANEWKLARQLGADYWLYIVTGALSDTPELTRVKDPASHFREEEDIFATGFMIREDSWKSKGEAVGS